ncbi:T15D22.8 [Salix viminalis]|uniref:T15D22.8 n=1 Tax=Salix viminalis TaxID=40686 RepID=A0A9Q0NNW0_SALVM|nr:T15D22.8 [Salix viminalis]
MHSFLNFQMHMVPLYPSGRAIWSIDRIQSCIHDLNSLWQPPAVRPLDNIMFPYLSAIQIYSNKSVVASRSSREHNDVVELESDSWSDDSTSDKLSRSLSNNSSKTWDTISEDSSVDHEGSLSTREKLGYRSFQYFEMSSPYWRVPLLEKITELARNNPGLMTLKNVDLSPASWMAVAWYPIYHIPSQGNEKDLSTCFLTYHTLSSSFQGILLSSTFYLFSRFLSGFSNFKE